MAIQSQPTRIPEPFAGSGTKNTIPATNATPSASQAASWASGFPPECSQPISAGGCPVPRNDVNGALNQLSQEYAFRQDGGIWEWSPLADYDAQRIVRGSNGLVYLSVAQSGPGLVAGAVDPVADDGTYWSQIPTMADIVALGYAVDSGVVHNTGDENIGGTKTFTDSLVIKNAGPYVTCEGENIEKGTVPSGTVAATMQFVDKNYGTEPSINKTRAGRISLTLTPAGASAFTSVDLYAYNWTAGSTTVRGVQFVNNGGSTSFRPAASSTSTTLGDASSYFADAYITSGSHIGSSDERLKTAVAEIPDEVMDAWGDVQWSQFQMIEAVEKKGGDAARIHMGTIAQRIDEIFQAHGLDASRYGLFCHDSWDAQLESIDEHGEIVAPAREAGDRYGLRYGECLVLEAAYQRRRAGRAEARLAALEERLAAIEAKLLNS